MYGTLGDLLKILSDQILGVVNPKSYILLSWLKDNVAN